MRKMFFDALDRHLFDQHTIILRPVRNQADVTGIALIAGARMRNIDQTDLHKLTTGCTSAFGIRAGQ